MSGKLILSAFSDEYADGLTEQLQMLRELGIGFTELRFIDGVSITEVEDNVLRTVKESLARYGIGVSAIASPLGKVALDGDLNAHAEKAKRTFERAAYLGAKNVRIFSFYAPEGKAIRNCRDEVFGEIDRLLTLAEPYGLTLCHENEGDIYGESPERCRELADAFQGRLKLIFDMGNFVCRGYRPFPDAYRLLEPYIEYFHLKDALYSHQIVPPGEGEAEIEAILNAYAAAHERPVFVTLEPHLSTFAGMATLTKTAIHTEEPSGDRREVFRYAASLAKKMVERITERGSVMRQFRWDELTVEIYRDRPAMGQAAARDIGAKIRELLEKKERVRMIFAAAPSQNEVLKALTEDRSIEWQRVDAFHMDEYIGLPDGAPQRFGTFLRDRLFSRVPFGSVEYIRGNAPDPGAECARYAKLLAENPPDIVVMGIGENGHIAFNDPGVTDFHDPAAVKIVQLDDVCRQQQVHDGCFRSIGEVPEKAMTLTVPTLVEAPWLFCIVPAKTKAEAVRAALYGPVAEQCPASILRTRKNAKLYLDRESASLL